MGSPGHVCHCDPGKTWTRHITLLTFIDPIPNQRDFGQTAIVLFGEPLSTVGPLLVSWALNRIQQVFL
jgi:hypothetical protein